jgi:[ribosomal protein S18]-alanine N-acetyltransferase
MNLRELRASEYKAVASWAIAEAWPGVSKDQVLSAQNFSELLQLPGHTSFGFANQDDQVIGFGQLWTNGIGRINLVRLLIAPQVRGRGLGLAMCRLLCESGFAIAGSSSLCLRVARQNRAAIRVYEKLGFKVSEAESNTVACAMTLSQEAFRSAQSVNHRNGDA